MRWSVPLNRLDTKQREVLDGVTRDLAQRHWIRGFAGTGKTVVMANLIERVGALEPAASLCFISFTHALKDLVATGFHGPIAQRIHVRTHTRFLSDRRRYDYVFLDEVQDISSAHLEQIARLSQHLYIAGDPEQRIYDGVASEEQIEKITGARTWKLVALHRLTRKLRDVALAIYPRSKIVEGMDVAGNRDVTIRMVRFDSAAQEAAWVWSEASNRARAADPAVILLPFHGDIYDFGCRIAEHLGLRAPPNPRHSHERKGFGLDYGAFNDHWRQADVPLMFLGSGHGSLPDSDTRPLVYLMTYHSSKGLDFKNVFLPRLDSNARFAAAGAVRQDAELEQRLLFVAVTRSRENLFLTHRSAMPHRLIAQLPATAVSPVALRAQALVEEEFF